MDVLLFIQQVPDGKKECPGGSLSDLTQSFLLLFCAGSWQVGCAEQPHGEPYAVLNDGNLFATEA